MTDVLAAVIAQADTIVRLWVAFIRPVQRCPLMAKTTAAEKHPPGHGVDEATASTDDACSAETAASSPDDIQPDEADPIEVATTAAAEKPAPAILPAVLRQRMELFPAMSVVAPPIDTGPLANAIPKPLTLAPEWEFQAVMVSLIAELVARLYPTTIATLAPMETELAVYASPMATPLTLDPDHANDAFVVLAVLVALL
jgi:hypothetical protein